MPLDKTTIETISTLIDQAFSRLLPPGDDKLLHPECRDDVDVQEFYGAIRCEALTDAMIVYGYAAPTAFSPEAFRYYLPAYLKWTLRNADSIDIAGESILMALDPGTDSDFLHAFRKSKFALFDEDQIAVVGTFLHAISEHPDLGPFAENALVNYWLDATG